jgi:CheY-like chemotaxis protein
MKALHHERILVIEDDSATRTFVVELLVDAGYEVRAACDGAEGIVSMSETRPDLIVVDLRMPVMDGWAFRRRQQDLDGFGKIPTIVVSGTSERPSLEQLGSATFVAKPFENDDLLRAVSTRLHPLPA